jgi:uncharacterized protein (TIGR02145 family)
MKNKLFRKNASVIPTGAPTLRSGQAARNGGIPSFRRFLATLGMTALFCWSATAQNGVTVSNLAVHAGTVTFNVSWKKADMPALWSDSVWVFVDYNKNGMMTRLPVTNANATAGTVTKVQGNDKGVWVIGNARTESSFSATVQLLTATADLSGACAYASNYPPVGEYIDATHISFTGTPMYKIVLEETAGGATLTDYSDGSYTMSGDRTVKSFTDATGAPGIMKCIVPASYTLQASASSFCEGSEGVQFALSGTEAERSYQLFRDNSAVGAVLNGNGNAATFTGSFNEEGTYTARTIADDKYCTIAMSGVHTIAAYPAFTVGEITTASTTTPAGINPDVTVQSSSPASGGSGNTTYLWLRTGMSAATLTENGAATYAMSPADYGTAGTHYFNRYAKDATCNSDWMAAAGTYTLMVELTGVNQKQGGCTFTQPPVVGTFANFPSTYSASTFVTLTDERDNNNYTVVKIGGRWIMGQNLNYQGTTNGSNTFTLYFNAESNKAHGNVHTASGPGTYAIGSFWCPGGYSSSTVTSTRASCNVWGALYTWETAMSLDGRGTWTEIAVYNAGAANASGSTYNHGRKNSSGTVTGGRGICPPNWHVPTDNEWGVIFDTMEGAGSSHTAGATGSAWYGSNAGKRAKAACTAPSGTTTGSVYVNDTTAYWYYNASNAGTDDFNFRALPSGYRNASGTNFSSRGSLNFFWASTAYDYISGWTRVLIHDQSKVCRQENVYNYDRTVGYSVRCIRDL